MKKLLIITFIAAFSCSIFSQEMVRDTICFFNCNHYENYSIRNRGWQSVDTTTTHLTVVGGMDARNFWSIRERLPNLTHLDLSRVQIHSYTSQRNSPAIGSRRDRTERLFNITDNVIPTSAFSALRNITRVILPESLLGIGSLAFASTGIDSIVIPSGVRFISGSAFVNNDNLKYVSLPDSLEAMGWSVFLNCINLSSIKIPEKVTEIPAWAFHNCSSLVTVTFPENLKLIYESAFEGCSSLTSITIPESVTAIGTWAFKNNHSLYTIQIPDGVFLGSEVFHNTAWHNSQKEGMVFLGNILYEYKGEMPPETRIKVPEGIRSIAGGAFSNQTGLTEITLPESLEYIGEFAFLRCKNLRSIHIPRGVKTIHQNAFNHTRSRSSYTTSRSSRNLWSNIRGTTMRIYVYWEDPSEINVHRFSRFVGSTIDRESTIFAPRIGRSILVVPRGTKEKYEQSEVWRDFRIVERRR